MSTNRNNRVRTTKMVPLDKLKGAEWNHPDRKSSEGLRRSMEQNGLHYPILVDSFKNLNVIEGHRRCHGAKYLGWSNIEAIEARNAEGRQQEIFADVNNLQKKLQGNESLYAFLCDPRSLMESLRKKMERAQSVLGRNLLNKMCEEGSSLQTYRTAAEASTRCGAQGNAKFTKLVVEWIMKHGSSDLRLALKRNCNPVKIKKAILEDQPLHVVVE